MKEQFLEKYRVDKDVSNETIFTTSLKYFKELEYGSLFSCGLNNDHGTILVDTVNNDLKVDRFGLDTLHDYCLFRTGESDFFKEQANELRKELLKMDLPVDFEFRSVYGNSYPGSKSFVFEHNNKLILKKFL